MNLIKKEKGAISIFLIIILVPCIVVASLFTDVSRVELSRILSVGSADLALNSLMTHYDSDLLDYYGFTASGQHIEQFYADCAIDYVNMLKSPNLLQMDVQTDNQSLISAVEGANLSDAAMIKRQIIEFMKYRVPDGELKRQELKELIESDNTEEMLDALYAAEYIISMFSHYTYENEGEYGYAKSQASKDQYKRSLTNKIIGEATHNMYSSETEYILYGGDESFNISNAANSINDLQERLDSGEKNDLLCEEMYLQYSDYLYLFLVTAFLEHTTSNSMFLRVGDVIQSNMRYITGMDDYQLKNSIVYFKLQSKIRVKPLMLSLPITGSYGSDLSSKEDWRTFEISITRGY